MQQLDRLWKYQEFDVEVDRHEAEMRADPARQKLLKHRNFLVEQQTLMKNVEDDVAAMADRLEAVRDEASRLNGLIAEQLALVEAPPEDQEEAHKRVMALQRLYDTLSRYDQEINKMRKDADVRDRQQHDIRVRAAKVKAEFDALKAQYDVAYKKQAGELEQLKARAAQQGKDLDPAMLKKYREIKQHSSPPMAKLNDDRCGGCNMSLPSVVLREIRARSAIVECDNCGRILYVPN